MSAAEWSWYKMNQVDNCVHYIANEAFFKASLVMRKDKLEAGWSYLGNCLTACLYVVVLMGLQARSQGLNIMLNSMKLCRCHASIPDPN